MHSRFPALVLALGLALVASVSVASADEGPETQHARARLVAESEGVRRGESTTIGLHLDIDPGWFVYWRNPGDSGLAPTVRWMVPDGVEVGEFEWPAPKRKTKGILGSFIYERTVLLTASLSVPEAYAGGTLEIEALADWLVCEEGCVPEDAHLTLTLPVLNGDPAVDPKNKALFASTRDLHPKALPGARTMVTDTHVEVLLPVEFDDSAQFEFLPYEWGVVNLVAEQSVMRVDSGVVVSVPRVQGPKPADVAGIVIVSTGAPPASTVKAYRVGVAPTIPVERFTAADLPEATKGVPVASDEKVEFDSYVGGAGPQSFLGALLAAFLGGLILNLMPCVLPVLSLKILGFVGQAGDDPKQIRGYGLAFGAGVVISFLALGGLLLALQAGGQQLGWGFQMQEPGFVAAMAFLMFVMALNLAGLFEIGLSVMSAAGNVQSRVEGTGYTPSFANGVLATLIATPCTAPFMGAAFAYAFGQPAPIVLATFAALGVGMAAPYVVLAYFPKLLEKLPTPGPWMDTFKQVMAFPLFATVIWLLWVFGKQTGIDGALWLMIGLLSAALGLWFYGRFAQAGRPRTLWIAGRLIPLALIVGGLIATFTHMSPPPSTGPRDVGDGWIAFSEDRVAELRAEGRPVFIDFTADWCLTCKFNESTFIETDAVDAVVEKHGFAMVKADWTNSDPEITRALARFNRASVPFYVLYSPDSSKRPLVLPEAITTGMVTNAMERIAGGS